MAENKSALENFDARLARPAEQTTEVPAEPEVSDRDEPGQNNSSTIPQVGQGQGGQQDPGQQGSAGQGGGFVVAPELPRPKTREEAADEVFAGGRPAPPVVLPEMNRPDDRPVDRPEFDPNPAPVPVDPDGLDPESFPGDGDGELGQILAGPNGVPGLFTFPLGPEEAPDEQAPDEQAPQEWAPQEWAPDGQNAGAPLNSPELVSEAVPVGSPTTPSSQVRQGPVRYAPVPGGGMGVEVDRQELAGASGTSTPGLLTTVQDENGVRYLSVQPTEVPHPDGTKTLFIPRPPGELVGKNLEGRTVTVYRLGQGQTGRVTPSTPVDRVRVRTSSDTLELNGGGGPNAVPGMVFRDPVSGNPTQEEWTVSPAYTIDPVTGMGNYSAMVPAGHENRVDLTQGGTIRLRVPAGTRPVPVAQQVQAFTPYAPTPTSSRTAPASGPTPITSTPTTPAPAYTRPVPTPPRSTQPSTPRRTQPAAQPARAPQPQNGLGRILPGFTQGGGQLLNRAAQTSRQWWNDQPVTVSAVPAGVQVVFMDRRVGIYNPANGNKISGAGPDRVHPFQISTPAAALNEAGQLLDGLGNLIQNFPPIPGLNLLQQRTH
jgi:hypothetical protein